MQIDLAGEVETLSFSRCFNLCDLWKGKKKKEKRKSPLCLNSFARTNSVRRLKKKWRGNRYGKRAVEEREEITSVSSMLLFAVSLIRGYRL